MRTEEKIIENYTDIPALLKNCGARRPFLCCGKSFEKTDAFAYLQAHCRLTVWDTVRPNPRYEDMVRQPNYTAKKAATLSSAPAAVRPWTAPK